MKKDFSILFAVNLILRIILQGLLPIFPVFIASFAISKQHIGFIIAAAYLILFATTYVTGKLVPNFVNSKTVFLCSIFPLALSIFLIGTAHNIVLAIAFMLLLFFSSGFNIASSNILIGYFSNKHTAGKNYGILGLSNIFGTLLGGFIIGPTLFKMGYPMGFAVLASVFFVVSLSSFAVTKPPQHIAVAQKQKMSQNIKPFIWLIISSLLAIVTIHAFIFTSSLMLTKNGYTIKDISIYSALGTILASPTPFVFGLIAKTVPPKKLLIIIYSLAMAALTILSFPLFIPAYLIAVAFIGVLSFATRPVIMALIFDWFTEQQLPMAQSYLGMAAWFAAIIGYLATGSLLQHAGQTITLLSGIAVLILAIIITIFGVKTDIQKSSLQV